MKSNVLPWFILLIGNERELLISIIPFKSKSIDFWVGLCRGSISIFNGDNFSDRSISELLFKFVVSNMGFNCSLSLSLSLPLLFVIFSDIFNGIILLLLLLSDSNKSWSIFSRKIEYIIFYEWLLIYTYFYIYIYNKHFSISISITICI